MEMNSQQERIIKYLNHRLQIVYKADIDYIDIAKKQLGIEKESSDEVQG